MAELKEQYISYIQANYPYLENTIRSAWRKQPEIVEQWFNTSLAWLVQVYGADAIQLAADGYAFFTTEVNVAQLRYEQCKHYARSSFEECNREVYQNEEYMRSYYWGVYAILFCWPHYVDLMHFYLERFVTPYAEDGSHILEIAPGHATWGLMALHASKNTQLTGVDISPVSIEIAPKYAQAAQLSERSNYIIANATKLPANLCDAVDLVICNFMLEHIESPQAFLTQIAHILKPGQKAFITLALTAAQPDHIYEFKQESEAILMAEQATFRVLESFSADAGKIRKNSPITPRIQALILQKT